MSEADDDGMDVVHDVFLSYPVGDLKQVRAFQEALEAAGLRVFRDVHDPLRGPERHLVVSPEQLARSKVLLAFHAAGYPVRRACQWTLAKAFVAASVAGEVGRRVLLVNPEAEIDHVPEPLRAQVLEATEPSVVADEVRRAVDRLATPLGPVASTPTRWCPDEGRTTPSFLDRSPLVWEIWSHLHGDAAAVRDDGTPEPVQLWAARGRGASAAAAEYAGRFSGLYPGGVFHVPVLGGPEVDGRPVARRHRVERMAVAAELLGERARTTPPGELDARLREQLAERGPTLWLVDDPTGALTEADPAWLPSAPDAHVLVAARGPSSTRRSIPLHPLELDDATLLLTRWSRPRDEQDEAAARTVAALLREDAVALEVASRSAGWQDEPRYASLATLLDASSASGDDRGGTSRSDAVPPGAVVVEDAISRLDADAAALLGAAVVLAADTPLPEDLLRQVAAGLWGGLDAEAAERGAGPSPAEDLVQPWDDELRVRFHAAVDASMHLDLLRPSGWRPWPWEVHPSVAQVVRDDGRLAPDEAVVAGMASWLAAALDRRAHRPLRLPEVRFVEHGRAVAARCDSVEVVALQLALSRTHVVARDHRVGIVWAARAMRWLARHDAGDRPEVVEARVLAGRALLGSGKRDEAQETLERAVAVGAAVLGADDRRTLDAQHHLARAEWSSGAHDRARARQAALVEVAEQVLGAEDPVARRARALLERMAD